MFITKKPESVGWPVTINVPQDGGTTKPVLFTGTFDVISSKEFNAFYEPGGKNDMGVALRVLKGWDKRLVDEANKPVEFSEKIRESFLETPFQLIAVVNAYIELSQGRAAAVKN